MSRATAEPAAAPSSAADDPGEVFVFPVSFAQQRLWFLDRLEPGSTLYNMPMVQRLQGPLDPDAFRRALAEVVRRHEVLRTTFPTLDGEPVQAVAPPAPVPVPLEDLSALPEAERGAAALRRVAEETQRPFDLKRGPLLRVTVLRLDEDDHVVVFALHHAVGDGWSLGVLTREVAALHDAFRAGRPSPLPELPIQYADFAAWQREWLSGDELERQIAWWREHFRGAPPVLELPTDRPRPATRTYRGETVQVALPRRLVDALHALARREGASLFMVLLSAWQALLSRWSGQDHVVVGTPIAGRAQEETEPLIGLFINTLALHADLSGDPPFREALARVREATLGAFAHQDLPFEKLVEELKVERSLSHSPLFQVLFNLLNTPPLADAEGPGGTRATPWPSGIETEKYDLTLTVMEHEAGAAATLSFNPDLFDRATVERMVGHYRRVLEAVAAEPAARLSALPLMSADERARLAERWAGEDRPAYPRRGLLHRAVEAQARRTPHAPAVRAGGAVLTFAELERRAARLARRLAAVGVRPEVPVAVCMDRSPELMVALLGTLKAGGAYVPVDPAYPAERRAYMVEDSGAAVVLTQPHLLPDAAAEGVPVLALEPGWSGDAADDEGPALPPVDPAHAAYVIYTSGSTGRPKGVVVPHASAVHFLAWTAEVFDEDGVELLPLHTRISFDASLKQLWTPLLRGRPVWMLPDESTVAPAELLRRLGAERGAAFNCVPGLWAAMLDAVEAGEPAPAPGALVAVYTGGERLPPETVRRTRALLPHLRLRNIYGPTECTSISVAAVADAGQDRGIGRPIPHARAYVLDPRGGPAPVGVPGELWLGGPGVARGYLRRPSLTAERFAPDPFSPEPGARIYRTGDRARYREDGTLEYLGRLDDQVKVRGYRIEPGEIEAVLRAHPAVGAAAVAVREDRPGDVRLVAYVAPRDAAAAPDAAELKRACAAALPEFMVPAAFVGLEALPLTPNGKLDRRALPAPELPAPSAAFAAAESPVERTLAAVWAEVLGTEQVGANDNFFELGGHSLLLTRVQLRVQEALGREVPMVDLFRFPTVRSLAAHLAGGEGASAAADRTERGRDRADSRRAARERRRGR